MDSRMCSAQKCAFWQREAEPTTCKGPERLLRTSAVSELDVPTTYHNFTQVRFLSLQVFVTYCANATTKPVLARTSTSVPRTRSSFSAFAFTVTHIVNVTGKPGSYDHTADSFSQSPMVSATRSPKQASEGAQDQTPDKESISI